MGCCISTKCPKTPLNSVSVSSSDEKKEEEHKNRAASPPCVEEETVKEVLLHSVSETLIAKPQIPVREEEKIPEEENVVTVTEKEKPITQVEENGDKEKLKTLYIEEDKTPELSQVSEICSLTGSYSTATTATTIAGDRREDEVTSKPWRENASFAKPRRNRELSNQDKRAQVGPRLIRGRDSAKVVTKRRNVGSTDIPTEGSTIRRSRSPATRTVGRRSPMKASGPSSKKEVVKGKVVGEVASRRSRSPAVGRRSPMKATGAAGSKSADVGGEKEKSNGGVSGQGTETIENPLVSLECFIFL